MTSVTPTIQKVGVHQVDLVYVLSSCGCIFVLNHTLANDQDGLIFKFKIPFLTSPLVGFFLLPEADLQHHGEAGLPASPDRGGPRD